MTRDGSVTLNFDASIYPPTQFASPGPISKVQADDGPPSDRITIGPAITAISTPSLLWAVAQGIEAARDLDPEFLLPTDADILHSPTSIRDLVSLAETGQYDLTSLMPMLHCLTAAEKILIPALCFSSLSFIHPLG
jgi:hypothetical protein